MAYELTIQTADNISSTDLNDNVTNSVDESKFILSDRQTDFSKREATFNRPAHNYAQYYISDRADPTTAISSLESVVANADWAKIEGRHVWTEYQHEKYLSDETYYPYEAQNLLRAPPKIEYIDGFEGKISEAHFLIGATEYSVTDEQLTFDQPSDYIRCDAVVADSNGNVSIVKGQEHPEPKANGIEWPQRPQTAADEMVGAYVIVKSALDRIPRSGIEIVDVVGDDGTRSVDYEHGTIPDNI